MKTTLKTGLAALLLFLAISCKKENSSIQSSGINSVSSTRDALTEASALAGNTVRIGSQVWMKKNWTGKTYRNGDKILQVQDTRKWSKLTTGAWCWYNNDSATGTVYGRLYNWYAVNDPRGLAPEGWHIPSDSEWTILSTFLGGESVAGGKMKSPGTLEAGTGLWYTPNTDATNSSGFTGLPGGGRTNTGDFSDMNASGGWWSYNSNVHYWYLYYEWGTFNSSSYFKQNGFSVRCLKD
ncbi:MAG TPA: fibrobacter succinogenes major paralogous domain-containing protein [Panacibacter sp.]|nr:fibrobacter succinogenes major paralogous domain-containing protein [Panacibacter sp.]